MIRIVGSLLALALLSGCAWGPPRNSIRDDAPIFDSVVQEFYYGRADLALACLDKRGIFTSDRQACFVQRKGECFYLTAPNDRAHDRDLTALCNGYRPTPPLELF